ncbi:MAG: transketolase [Verrucomicrobia bacterium]|nr:transketolase [Verrucomicrobiota bacterium]
MTERDLKLKSVQYRKALLRLIKAAGAGHTGGDLSCLDILNVLYNRILRVSPETFKGPDHDHYIQSKGHCAEALFVVLADRGFFPPKDLESLNRYGSHYLGHPTREVYGVEQNTGALGHGLAVAVGLALAGKMDRKDYRVFCLLGDGELAEGSNWEAAMTAAHYRLDNLVAIVDRNGLQITGSTEDVCQLSPLDEKFAAFGWAVHRCDGHDVGELVRTLEAMPFRPGKPSVVLAKTRKGKGVSFMENVAKWHHGVPNDEEFNRALAELEAAEAALA